MIQLGSTFSVQTESVASDFSTMDYRGIAKYAYRLCETHETIEWHIISSELDAFRIRNTEGMIVQA